MNSDSHKQLAERLDALPNGFPATEEGLEIRLLKKLFTPDEAALASCLRLELEPIEKIASRLKDEGYPTEDLSILKSQLKKHDA